MSRLSVLLMLIVAAASAANAQGYFWDELKEGTIMGAGCSYSLDRIEGPYPDIRCWAQGDCWNYRHFLDVAWYQSWTCVPPNHVFAYGHSAVIWLGPAYDYYTNEWREYKGGLIADGAAFVHKIQQSGFWLIEPYSGWDERWCDAWSSYSGLYFYTC
jgi:hypothetical protein